MRIEFDPKKAKSNRRKHGVTFEEAETCLLDPYALVQEDPDTNNEARFVLIGLSNQARLLTVVYSLPEEETVRLISARLSTTKEANYYA
jgi:uncharacterized DUF497 family protein